MILQALTEYYEKLREIDDKTPSLGWGNVKVSYALEIDSEGELLNVISLKTEQQRGKKSMLLPTEMVVPAPVKRSSGVASNFLCDNSAYILGFDNKGKPDRSVKCFNACRELHTELLKNVDVPAAGAICKFFEKWNPRNAPTEPKLHDYVEDISSGANLVFLFNDTFVHEESLIRRNWESHYLSSSGGKTMACLVTGENSEIELTHPSIKGVMGAQSSGAALVSFNAPSFCSYGKEQNLNAPVGKYAVFAYTTALNKLLADRENVSRMGDTTVVYWAKSGEEEYQSLFSCYGFDKVSNYSEQDVYRMISELCAGKNVNFNSNNLDPDMDFYVLGLAPNAARLSVRFFFRNSFGNFLNNIRLHHERMNIIKPNFDKFESLPLWKMLDETVNKNSKDKTPVPNMSGEVLRSILNNSSYPATLINGVQLRIKAEQEINRGRAAIIKAYYLKNTNIDVPKEVLQVALNTECTNVPYNLGRLFSVLEAIQAAANPGINSTIRDRYFSSASATPAQVFPVLLNLTQKHLKKISGGLEVVYNKQITEIMAKLGENYPTHMNLAQQGSFQLGYYHQTQARFTKKEEK